MFSTIAVVAGLLAMVPFSAAAPFLPASPLAKTCLNDHSAQQVANNFRSLITNYNSKFASAVLCENFVDYSDSVNELINSGCPNGTQPLGSPTFTSRNGFESGQGTQPGIPFQILNVWHSCDTVVMRWRSTSPGTKLPEQQVTGIIIMETKFVGWDIPESYLIQTVYSEFNSGAWLYDLGVFAPTCSA